MKDIYDDSYLVEDQDGQLRRKRPPDNLLCDFCCGPLGDHCWTYPCGDIELPLVMDPTGLPARSDDSWACCLECHPQVQAKDWRKLAERSFWVQFSMTGETIMAIPPTFCDEFCGEIIQHFERFDAARTGEPYQEHAPYKIE